MRKLLLIATFLLVGIRARAQSNAFSVQPLTGERVQVMGGSVFTGSANVVIPTTILTLTDNTINYIYITNLGGW